MMPEMPSSRRRAIHRRNLYLMVAGVAAAAACLLVEPVETGADAAPAERMSPGAPPEIAVRPNAPTEPVMGARAPGPGS